ncbi:hypothetical protein E1A91_D08G045300v1 [Gossypium mustelinum]|uniref:Uncharacterized protein n=1 Tax=Gossypium mustelinum TaxID=34275 RepID=A0A5D2TTX9_GOSMU|nr:hypothetical protein E1A91_D08G045300v1 [Gossypium mustelinum]
MRPRPRPMVFVRDADHRRSSAKASSLPTTSSPMPISSTTSKTILMTPILTKKIKKNRFNTDLEEKKKKLKINVHRPVWTRVVFDEEGNTQAPLAMLADKTSGDILLDQDIEGVVEDSISSS